MISVPSPQTIFTVLDVDFVKLWWKTVRHLMNGFRLKVKTKIFELMNYFTKKQISVRIGDLSDRNGDLSVRKEDVSVRKSMRLQCMSRNLPTYF